MVGVCTIWDETFTTGIAVKRWYNLYKQAAKALGATHLIWIQGEHAVPEVADQEITTEAYDHLADVRTAYPGATLVFLDVAEEALDLTDFSHPPGDTIYVVGTDADGLGEHLVPAEGESVVKISASIDLWSHMAAAIALYDRQSKAA